MRRCGAHSHAARRLGAAAIEVVQLTTGSGADRDTVYTARRWEDVAADPIGGV